VPKDELTRAAADINRAIVAGALTELPVHRFSFDDIAAAHEAVEAGIVGKVLVDIE
jgi:NADPH2:quinone reductase